MSYLEATNHKNSILKDSNQIQKAINSFSEDLWSNKTINIRLIWGIETELKLNPNSSQWSSQKNGEIVFD